MKYNRMSRRMFLQGTGAMMPMPFLASLLPRTTWGATPIVQKRYIAMLTELDIGAHANWLPMLNVPSNVVQGVNIAGHAPVYYQSLQSMLTGGRTSLSPIFGSWVNPFLSKMSILRGLDHATAYGHAYLQGCAPTMGNLTACSNPALYSQHAIPTIDQVLVRNKTFNPTGKDSIYLNGLANSGSVFGFGPDGQSVVPRGTTGYGPQDVFNRIFANGNYPEYGSPPPATRNPRSDVLSRVHDDYTRVINGRQISSVDKAALTNAMDKISDVQKSLTQLITVEPACHYKGISIPSASTMYGANPTEFFKYSNSPMLNALCDVMCAAIFCDVTNVAVLHQGFAGELQPTGYATDATLGFHGGISHLPLVVQNGIPNWQRMGVAQGDFVQYLVARVLTALDGATDPSNGKSYLYNSVLQWGSEHSLTHFWGNMPTALFGNAAGSLPAGNFVDYCDRSLGVFAGDQGGWSTNPTDPNFSNSWRGVSYNRVLVTIMQSLGLVPADYENIIPGINQTLLHQTGGAMGAQNNNITYVGGYGIAAWGTNYNSPSYSPSSGQDLAAYSKYNFNHYKYPLPLPPQA